MYSQLNEQFFLMWVIDAYSQDQFKEKQNQIKFDCIYCCIDFVEVTQLTDYYFTGLFSKHVSLGKNHYIIIFT